MGQYMLKRTLVKHSDSINTLAFSYDGSLFASGADDGLVIIFEGNGKGQELHQFQAKAPIAALLWQSCSGFTLLAGDTCGDVHTICLCDSGHSIRACPAAELPLRAPAKNENPFSWLLNPAMGLSGANFGAGCDLGRMRQPCQKSCWMKNDSRVVSHPFSFSFSPM